MTDLIGFMGAFLTTISFLPQAIKTIRTRDTRGISLKMYVIFLCGVCFWLFYGILLNNWIMIIANVITLFFSGTVLWVKLQNCQEKED